VLTTAINIAWQAAPIRFHELSNLPMAKYSILLATKITTKALHERLVTSAPVDEAPSYPLVTISDAGLLSRKTILRQSFLAYLGALERYVLGGIGDCKETER
jgi:hypothetical protein